VAKKRKHKRSTAHLRKYQFKSKRRSKPVAKKRRKRKSTRRAPARRSHARRTRRRGGHRGGGGGGFALKPSGDDIKLMAASAGIGFLETKAKADANFFLNKVPKPVNQLGYTGNLALVLWVASHFTKNRWLRLGARAAANITSYHIGRMGKTFSSGAEFFTVSGWSDEEVASVLETASMGALNPEGDNMPGVVAYDDADMAY
jgi:hypothetical protein